MFDSFAKILTLKIESFRNFATVFKILRVNLSIAAYSIFLADSKKYFEIMCLVYSSPRVSYLQC